MKRYPWITIILVSITFLVPSAFGTQYKYDNLHRLTRVTYDNGIYITYTYDEVGNRTQQDFYIEGTTLEYPVWRFWSPKLECHFYTINEAEKDFVLTTWSDVWTFEDVAYYAFQSDSEPNLMPVYRFWSPKNECHFYTISESEKDYVSATWPDVWTYEGIVFYAFPIGQQPADAKPVYRFWSPTLECHFYTISETEKNKVIDNYPLVWTFEGIAWYAYE